MKRHKRTTILVATVILSGFVLNKCTRQNNFPELKGPYLGQKPPGKTPEIFAIGIVSTDKDEINAVFSTDGKEFNYSRDTYRNMSKAGRDYAIMFMTAKQSSWTKPQVVSFAGEYMNGDMFITRNGGKLYFFSDRPMKNAAGRKADSDIWVVERTEDGWSEPENLGSSVNSEKNEWYPTMTNSGTLYFSSDREGGAGGSDLYRSVYKNGQYQNAENLGKPVNTKYNEGDVFISPDESYLIVVSSNRPDTYGSGDLYISFRTQNGTWTEAKNMGKDVNTEALEYCPMISPDGKYLFFTSRRRGNDDIYWVDTKIIEEVKNR